MRWVRVLVLAGLALYYLYENFDNPTLRVVEAVLDNELSDKTTPILLNSLGLPSTVRDKLIRSGYGGSSFEAVPDAEFTGSRLNALSAKYGRAALGLKFQVEIVSGYARVTLVRLTSNGLATVKYFKVVYQPKEDKWVIS
jgi:hypothetical protein